MSGIVKHKSMPDIFESIFYLLFRKSVINEREYEELRGVCGEDSTPDDLVLALLDVAGRREYVEEYVKVPHDEFL